MEKVRIKIDHWDHECGDGCCYLFGTSIEVNGKFLSSDSDDLETRLTEVLEHLGYDVEMEISYNGE